MDLLPNIYNPHGALTRKQEQAFARSSAAAAYELLETQHAELVERAKLRAIGGAIEEAVDQIAEIDDEVVRLVMHNPLAGRHAAELSETGKAVMEKRIKQLGRRLG